ncbi:MAG: hypothetical protein V4681_00360 [Patescibacteria group bacterium]
MIYLFHGSDTNKVRAKAFAWVAAARAKAPEAAYIRISADQVSASSLLEALSSQGLFFTKTLVLLDDPFALSESGEMVLEHIDLLASSDNPVAVLAPKLLAARAKKLEAVAEKTFKIDAVASKDRGFNSALVNALAAKDSAALWKEIIKATRAGDAPEAVHGLLHWKARDLMQKGGRGWDKEETRALSLSLIELLSDSRGRDLPLPLALERFALAL